MTDLRLNKILITDLHAFGSINYYIALDECNILIFEQYEHFQKGSYSNRYYIAGPQGSMLLSVPVAHLHRERTPLKDLRICYRDRWQLLHWRTLTSAYRRSPWFEFYEDDLRGLYENNFVYLIDWNLQAFQLVSQWLGRSWEISQTETYVAHYSPDRFTDIRHRLRPRDRNKDEADTAFYQQVFQSRTGFLPGLSILDLIFCEGPRSLQVLRNYAHQSGGAPEAGLR